MARLWGWRPEKTRAVSGTALCPVTWYALVEQRHCVVDCAGWSAVEWNGRVPLPGRGLSFIARPSHKVHGGITTLPVCQQHNRACQERVGCNCGFIHLLTRRWCLVNKPRPTVALTVPRRRARTTTTPTRASPGHTPKHTPGHTRNQPHPRHVRYQHWSSRCACCDIVSLWMAPSSRPTAVVLPAAITLAQNFNN